MATNQTKTTPALAVTTHDESQSLTLTFANGDSLMLDAGKLSDDIRQAAMLHGLKQKLVDAAAISRDPSNGRAATVEVKYAAVKEVFDRLLAGEWNKRREGGGNTGGLLFRALCEMYDGRKSPEQIKEYLAERSDKEKAALRKNPKVAVIIDRLRAAEGDAGDSDDLLAELEGGE